LYGCDSAKRYLIQWVSKTVLVRLRRLAVFLGDDRVQKVPVLQVDVHSAVQPAHLDLVKYRLLLGEFYAVFQYDVAEGPVLAIHQPDRILNAMDEWNTRQHGQSGLIERVRRSKLTARDAELQTLEFLKKWVNPKVSPMCGNSICQDRRFLHRLMPELEQYFHYRNLDVSTVKELSKRWRPEIMSGLKKNASHLAMDDIRDSISELKYYREYFFIMNTDGKD